MSAAKDRQISVRVASDRQLVERERAREREQELLEMFNKAATDVTKEDLEERESLLGGFSGGLVD